MGEVKTSLISDLPLKPPYSSKGPSLYPTSQCWSLVVCLSSTWSSALDSSTGGISKHNISHHTFPRISLLIHKLNCHVSTILNTLTYLMCFGHFGSKQGVMAWKNLVYQMWLSISLEEDLSSFERGLFQSKKIIIQFPFSIYCMYKFSLPKGWLRDLCDWHLHGDVLQHHHRLGRLLLRCKVAQLLHQDPTCDLWVRKCVELLGCLRLCYDKFFLDNFQFMIPMSIMWFRLRIWFAASSQQENMQQIARSV